MMFGCCFLFAVTFLTNFSAAFSQHGNPSKAEALAVNAKPANSMLADSNQILDSPGKQYGSDVGFLKAGPLNLTLGNLVFVLYSSPQTTASCKSSQFGICYDAYSPDGEASSCLPSQCFLKIDMDEEGNVRVEGSKWVSHPNFEKQFATFSFPDSSSSLCKPKIENGMIQLKVISIGCPVKAKDAQIKFPEIPSTTLEPSHKAAGDSINQASFWNEGGWIILVVVLCLLGCILLVGGAVLLFYCLKKKRNSIKAPPPPSIIAADKKSIAMGQQPSVVMPNADLKKKKKKNDGKKVNAAAEKPPLKKNTQKIAAAAADVPKKRSSESVEDEFICRTDEWLPESALEELKKSRT